MSALALAACAAPDGSDAIDISDSDSSLVWASWPSYIDEDLSGSSATLKAFKKETGIEVEYKAVVKDNVGFYLTMKDQLSLGQPTGADIICVSDWMAARLIRFGYAQKFDSANMPNKANLTKTLSSPEFDPKREYSLPWQSGFIGLAWNAEEYPKGLVSVEQLWNDDLKGKVVVLAEMRHTMGMLLLANGVDISDGNWGIDEFKKASAVLETHLASKHILGVYGSDYLDKLKSGEALAGFARAGDVAVLNAQAGYEKFKFLLPGSRGTFFTDSLVIPAGAQHKANAEKLMNFYYDPAIATEVVEWIHCVSPVDGTLEYAIENFPKLASNQFTFPNATAMSRASTFRTLSTTDDQSFNAEFRRITGKG
ncbi:spermidine/putrescine transport system substrate-binding protein [Salinibacterium amurskyense]|uniref:Spermidine/putrescine transport system substrate-binding protein n=1 Tax=Salinibacterium amurskyense TaxID=205941 RepID=A0A2M9D1L8_9MICO|nr:spermidine/putrescine ABC transporter substrate-binding protein [Salinibacterium amurskyense]PJJ78086.1 spermidine/putrescine transport system substrate-binding protein [Salinibacterium amurskyense]GHD82501.1 polyamine-binding lipoprotein [Salinibacterium amurskyense]